MTIEFDSKNGVFMSKTYGYCRISTQNQSLDRQERNIKTLYPNAIIVKEAFTGRSLERPNWQKLYKQVKPGDTIIFDEVSRMSRDADEGFALYLEFFEKDVNLIFIKESHINTDVYREALQRNIEVEGGDAVIKAVLGGVNEALKIIAQRQIKLAFEASQHEVDFLSQRTKEGIETARLNGKQIGGKPGDTYVIKHKAPIQEIIKKKSRDFDGKNTDVEVIAIINSTKYVDGNGLERLYHISNNTYYKYKRELKSEATAVAVKLNDKIASSL